MTNSRQRKKARSRRSIPDYRPQPKSKCKLPILQSVLIECLEFFLTCVNYISFPKIRYIRQKKYYKSVAIICKSREGNLPRKRFTFLWITYKNANRCWWFRLHVQIIVFFHHVFLFKEFNPHAPDKGWCSLTKLVVEGDTSRIKHVL